VRPCSSEQLCSNAISIISDNSLLIDMIVVL